MVARAAAVLATGYLLVSTAYDSTAVPTDRMSAIVRFCLPRSMAFRRFGIAIAAMIPMIATTIRSSISVNPACLLDFIMSGVPPLLPTQEQGRCHTRTASRGTRQTTELEKDVRRIPTIGTIVPALRRSIRVRVE